MERARGTPLIDSIDVSILQQKFPIETIKLAEKLDINRKNLWEHLNRLEALGLIQRDREGKIIWIDLTPDYVKGLATGIKYISKLMSKLEKSK